MSWSRDLPITWSRHVTTHMIYSPDLDTWPFRTPSQHQVIIDTNICVIIPMSWLRPGRSFRHVCATSTSLSLRKTTFIFQWWWRERRFSSIAINESYWEITSRSTPIQIPVVVAWEGVTSIAINESHWKPVVVAWEGVFLDRH